MLVGKGRAAQKAMMTIRSPSSSRRPSAPPVAMDPTRDAACRLLNAVLEQHRSLEEALNALPPMEPRDRAAAHRLAAATLRRLGTIDAVLEPFLRREPPAPVRDILRLGAAGLLFLDTPPHAAVGTAVDLARQLRLAPFTGLINAVLRKVATGGQEMLNGLDSPRLDTPGWLWTAWGRDARAIALAHQTEAPLDLTLRPGITPPAEGILLPNGTVRLPAGTRVSILPGFEEGAFWVQDAAASLPARLLAAREGEKIVDLCAAPGGKTAQLAMSGAEVIAVEREAARVPRLRENLARLRLDVQVAVADAAEWTPPAGFVPDAILLDAPCSATGTIRRHPDVPHLKRQRDITALTAQQDRLLAAALAMLRPGGRLIYAVCSMQPEEGRQRIEHALKTLPSVTLSPFTVEELAFLPGARTAEGYLRTHPGLAFAGPEGSPPITGMDGFFAARLTVR
ncbi:16S rRNA m(5)C 967 methyltransferase [Granulibacter bethesdensis]|nr:16S rRNA m(5)C 967 methyltransferase [Granulibacter bethesdensis]